jgi:hypothetical protein
MKSVYRNEQPKLPPPPQRPPKSYVCKTNDVMKDRFEAAENPCDRCRWMDEVAETEFPCSRCVHNNIRTADVV